MPERHEHAPTQRRWRLWRSFLFIFVVSAAFWTLVAMFVRWRLR